MKIIVIVIAISIIGLVFSEPITKALEFAKGIYNKAKPLIDKTKPKFDDVLDKTEKIVNVTKILIDNADDI